MALNGSNLRGFLGIGQVIPEFQIAVGDKIVESRGQNGGQLRTYL